MVKSDRRKRDMVKLKDDVNSIEKVSNIRSYLIKGIKK